MSKQFKAYIKNLDAYVPFNGGDSVGSLLESLPGGLGFTPICARVNNKTEGLSFPLFAPKEIEFLPVSSASGMRVYVRSLCMMLYRACATLFPHSRLEICHSISGGYLCRIHGVEASDENAAALKDEMMRLHRAGLEFERKERRTPDVMDLFAAQGLDDKVRLLGTIHEPYTVYYRLDGINDYYYGALAPDTSYVGVFDFKPLHGGFLLLPPTRKAPDVPAQPVTQHKMYEAFTDNVRFNRVVGVADVGALNRASESGRSAELINVAEALHDKRISGIADEIAARFHRGGARMVLLAGPSSSGKTTTAKRLSIYLMTNLLKPKMISLDDYFVNRDQTPRDSTGEYDYESIHALDLERFNADLAALLRGEEVALPTYNFALGKREYRGNTLRLDPDTILVIEGIHGLNPMLTASIDESQKFRIYVSALTTLAIDDHNWVPTSDNRLLRRIIRDHKYRGTSPLDTIRRWPSVRRGEERWIFPYQENADATFNSSLIFELAVMKPYAEEILRYFPRDVPEYAEAYRLMRFLGYFRPIPSTDIPPTSLLREFLGGSSLKY